MGEKVICNIRARQGSEVYIKVARNALVKVGFKYRPEIQWGWAVHTSKEMRSGRAAAHAESLSALIDLCVFPMYTFPIVLFSLSNYASFRHLFMSLFLPQSLPHSVFGLFQLHIRKHCLRGWTDSVALRIGCLLKYHVLACMYVYLTKQQGQKGLGMHPEKGCHRARKSTCFLMSLCFQKCKGVGFHSISKIIILLHFNN